MPESNWRQQHSPSPKSTTSMQPPLSKFYHGPVTGWNSAESSPGPEGLRLLLTPRRMFVNQGHRLHLQPESPSRLCSVVAPSKSIWSLSSWFASVVARMALASTISTSSKPVHKRPLHIKQLRSNIRSKRYFRQPYLGQRSIRCVKLGRQLQAQAVPRPPPCDQTTTTGTSFAFRERPA